MKSEIFLRSTNIFFAAGRNGMFLYQQSTGLFPFAFACKYLKNLRDCQPFG